MTFKSERSKVNRLPSRGQYDEKTIFDILDQTSWCHVSFCVDGQPFIIPTIYGREGKTLYFHGSVKSRLIEHLGAGNPAAVAVSFMDGLVLARSLFNSSMNYRSAIVYGKGRLITDDDEKMKALEIITDQILEGRWDEARIPSDEELKATGVVAMEIEDGAAKIRTGPPGDKKSDYELDIWAGVVETKTVITQVIPDEKNKPNLPVPPSVQKL